MRTTQQQESGVRAGGSGRRQALEGPQPDTEEEAQDPLQLVTNRAAELQK